MRQSTRARMERLVAHIAALALAGGNLPATVALAEALGLGYPEDVTRLLTLAQAAGVVRLRRSAARHVVEVAAADGSWRACRGAALAEPAPEAALPAPPAPRAGTRMARLLDHIAGLARAGRDIPSSIDLAATLDFAGEWEVSELLRRAELDGLIVLHRDGRAITGFLAPDGGWRAHRAGSAPAARRAGSALPGKPQRLCLRCREPFAPEHRHNFLCAPCGAANRGEAA